MSAHNAIYKYGKLGLTTSNLNGIGGIYKQCAEDFVVEEIPAYQPCGSGEYLFVKLRKRGLSAADMLRRIAALCAVSEEEIGMAGIKDTHAVTTQYISLPRRVEERLSLIEGDDLTILECSCHDNKLKTGHLKGNRFSVVIRDLQPGFFALAKPICDQLAREGFLNFYDSQRFGDEGKTARDGMRLLRGEKGRFRGGWHKRLILSSAQAYMFNSYLYERYQKWGRELHNGDLVAKSDTGGVFWIDDRAIEIPRYERGEFVITGPIYGRKMREPTGEPGVFEREIMANLGVEQSMFSEFGKLMLGSRRPIFVLPQELTYNPREEERALELSFTLPSGSYATVLLAELMKKREESSE